MIDSLIEQDSDLANELKSQRLKFISKKASSYELLEKYLDAFNEYEILMKLDSTFQNAQQSYNRIRKILNETGQLQKRKTNEKDSQTSNEKFHRKIEILNINSSERMKVGEQMDIFFK